MNKKLIYVAGKYTASNYSGIEDNIKKAEAVSIKLFSLGWAVFTPHKNTAHYEIYESVTDLDYDFWMECCFEILSRCDAIFMMDGWKESSGSLREHEFAKKCGIEIYHGIPGYPEP